MLGLEKCYQIMRGGGEGNIGIGGSSGFLNILSPRFYYFGIFVGSLLLSVTALGALALEEKFDDIESRNEDNHSST
jgi:hypothetical protein